LDFFVLFSSVGAVLGNVGQADYAYANAFLDAFCEVRERWRSLGYRSGRSCAIDWGLWRDGGMQVPADTLRAIARTTGMVPMETGSALDALRHALTTAPSRFLVVQGDRDLLRRTFTGSSVHISRADDARSAVPPDSSMASIEATLRRLVARALKIDVHRLSDAESLGQYGMDSITFVELADALNEELGLDLSPAIFFDHPSIARLAAHLRSRYPGPTVFATRSEPAGPTLRTRTGRDDPDAGARRSAFTSQVAPVAVGSGTSETPIAIVGMSGVMPRSEDLDAFWRHLEARADLIEEIPADRWDWRTVLGDPATESNKTNSKWGGF